MHSVNTCTPIQGVVSCATISQSDCGPLLYESFTCNFSWLLAGPTGRRPQHLFHILWAIAGPGR